MSCYNVYIATKLRNITIYNHETFLYYMNILTFSLGVIVVSRGKQYVSFDCIYHRKTKEPRM